MSATRHGIIRIETVQGDSGYGSATARARCACGKWRQAGSFPEYPGRAGAILLTVRRSDCGTGELDAYRIRWPFPADPGSMEQAAGALERKGLQLREEAARLITAAEEYEGGSARIRRDLASLGGGPEDS